jgi:hypothetical protein
MYVETTLTNKCTCGDGVEGVDQVKTVVEKSRQVREDLVIGRSRTSSETH